MTESHSDQAAIPAVESLAPREPLLLGPISRPAVDAVMNIELTDPEAAALTAAAEDFETAGQVFTDPAAFLRDAHLLGLGAIDRRVAASLYSLRHRSSHHTAAVISGIPIGQVPPTPDDPYSTVADGMQAPKMMAMIMSSLGDQIGVAGESDGRILHNIIAVEKFEEEQISFSSTAYLRMHVEAAFSPNRARFVVLLCLRQEIGQPPVGTRFCPVQPVLAMLTPGQRKILTEPRFETSVDLSIAGPGPSQHVGPMPIIEGEGFNFRFRCDFAETRAIAGDHEAEAVLARLEEAFEEHAISIDLRPGDMVIIDNDRSIHGRAAFTPSYDGEGRWLLRAYLVGDRSAMKKADDGNAVVVQPLAAV